ncbi:hypothetical protein ABZ783_24570 [Micromonospora sp. NPDC047738]|uniref:hypothetical protein n=1 Tax=Micromonospora sp. NPDC047738 TaxID=3155741 RepID=UPI0033EFBE7E
MGDTSFWYAEHDTFTTSPYTITAASDGFVFSGIKNYQGGDLLKLNFGFKIRYELQADRVPPSPIGKWRSSPHVNISGSLIGSSQDSPGWGDDWCKCWMNRRQTAYQLVFAPPGADPRRKIDERVESQNIFFSEDAPFTSEWHGPGFQPMPELILAHPLPAQSIWVELELRFDIQLEGYANLWIRPEQRFVVSADQWPALPL